MPPIIFFGSSPFSLPVLEQLILAKCQIAAVVTTPDKPVGRGLKLTPNAVKSLALLHNIPVIESLSELISIFDSRFSILKPVGLVAAYGRIIPQSVLDLFAGQIFNIHPSLLPKYRGASPLQFQILDGITETGVTIIQMDAEMDHGPIVAVQKDTISPTDTWITLGNRLFKLGAEVFLQLCSSLESREGLGVSYSPQDHQEATYTTKLTRESGFLPYEELQNLINHKSEVINRKLHAFSGWPGVWTINPSGKREKLISLNPLKIQTEGK